MSQNANYLHSHSGIEREMVFSKSDVLVDERYKDLFVEAQPYFYKDKLYYVVNIGTFIRRGGVFKNFKL